MRVIQDIWLYVDGFAICPLDVPNTSPLVKARAMQEKCSALMVSPRGAQIGRKPAFYREGVREVNNGPIT